MKYYSALSVFKFSWDQVAIAFWNRYPNPYSTHVLSEDTVCRRVIGSKLYSTRLLTKKNNYKLPHWAERFLPASKDICIVEESVIDRKNKTLTTYTRNIVMTRVMQVEEKCVYRPSEDNRDWTECERHAWITSGIFGMSYALQTYGYERFKKSITKTLKGYEHVLRKMYMPETVPETPAHILSVNPETLRQTAKKAKEIAKTKATSMVASNLG
ncbi:PRELI domain-containing protein 1, mitochondrial [Lamellibrachia satsuma]|nr:PRELI domain-containing protein 1, mitochondrial [Lamellibrachia satsuma]